MERIKLSSRERLELIKKLGAKCVYCGCNHLFMLELDHKKPLISVGKDIERNKQVTCHICNQLKSDFPPKEFKLFLRNLNSLAYLNKLNASTNMPKIRLKIHGNFNPELPDVIKKNNEILGEKNGAK